MILIKITTQSQREIYLCNFFQYSLESPNSHITLTYPASNALYLSTVQRQNNILSSALDVDLPDSTQSYRLATTL